MKNIYTLKDLTNQELNELVTKCYDELKERKKQKESELIETFKKALNDLREIGVEIRCECDCCGEDISLTFDSLYFY